MGGLETVISDVKYTWYVENGLTYMQTYWCGSLKSSEFWVLFSAVLFETNSYTAGEEVCRSWKAVF